MISEAKPSIPVANPPAHEELCTQCGKCCYKKIIVGRAVFITPFPCEFLDTAKNVCTIYDRRHELNPECLNVEQAIKYSAMPADCGYLPTHAPPGYRPALDTWKWDVNWTDFDDLADELEVSKEVVEKLRARGPFAPPLWEEGMAYQKKLKEQAAQAKLAPAAPHAPAAPLAPAAPDQAPKLAELARTPASVSPLSISGGRAS